MHCQRCRIISSVGQNFTATTASHTLFVSDDAPLCLNVSWLWRACMWGGEKKPEQGVAKELIIFWWEKIFIPEQVSKFAYGDSK